MDSSKNFKLAQPSTVQRSNVEGFSYPDYNVEKYDGDELFCSYFYPIYQRQFGCHSCISSLGSQSTTFEAELNTYERDMDDYAIWHAGPQI